MFRTSVAGVGRGIRGQQVESRMIKLGQMEPLIFLEGDVFILGTIVAANRF